MPRKLQAWYAHVCLRELPGTDHPTGNQRRLIHRAKDATVAAGFAASFWRAISS